MEKLFCIGLTFLLCCGLFNLSFSEASEANEKGEIFWALKLNSITAQPWEKTTSPVTFKTQIECQAVANKMVRQFPEHISAYCVMVCKGTNIQCDRVEATKPKRLL